MKEELLDQLTAIGIVLLFLALVGFAGWVTMEPEPVRVEIKQPQVIPMKERYLHGARAL